MPRLGELLTSARLVAPDKLEQALRAQVVWGGRLGTNLIEMHAIDLDDLSRVLGRQHGLPAALAKHFDKADAELQARLPTDLARQWLVVPLLHVGADHKIAVAAIDPLPAEALVALADAFLCAESGIVVSIAAELRIRYHLERAYGIQRSKRYLRSKNMTGAQLQVFDEISIEIGIDVDTDSDTDDGAVQQPIEATQQATSRASVPPPPVNVDDIAALIDEATESAKVPARDEPKGRDRRSYVRTLADETPVEPAARLARIEIKRVAVGPVAVEQRDAASLTQAMRSVKRAVNRDRVAELVIDSLQKFVPSCDGARLLVIRGDVAIGWRYFCRSGAVPSELAVPLDQPGLVPTAIHDKATTRAGALELGTIDQLLLASVGSPELDLAIVPIAIGDKVMCLIAIACEPGTPSRAAETIAEAAAAGFSRLIRDASR